MSLAARLGRALAAAAATVKHRKIIANAEGDVYLTRYLLARLWPGTPREVTVYLHHFRRGDEDPEPHDHPWAWSASLMLLGGYLEHRVADFGYVWQREVRPGMVNTIGPNDFHRVDMLDPEAGAWTVFVTGPKVKTWHFQNTRTGTLTEWRDRLRERGIGLP